MARRFARWAWLLGTVTLCASACGDDGGGPSGPDTGPRDLGVEAGPTACAADSDCDDGFYCNGPERCIRDESGGESACVRGTEPCAMDEACDEDGDRCERTCPDADGDGDPDASCGGGDCDDADPLRFTGNPELCDDVDQDCDDATLGPDVDGDGYVALVCCVGEGDARRCGDDCDDDDETRAPGLDEACDGADTDCDGVIPPGEDDDRDGHLSMACGGDDCDDTLATVHRGATELCNGIDDDCDGMRPSWDDADGDGYASDAAECRGGALPTTDCDDGAASIHPSAPEACDGLDSDCDGDRPAGDDEDGDGYAAVGASCEPGAFPSTDCDDARDDVHPGTTAACVVGEDRDCDGAAGSLRGGADAAITTAMRDRSQPSAVAVGANVLVAWIDLRDAGAPAVYAKLVAPDGSAVAGSTDTRLSTGSGTASRPVALATDDGGAIVVWSQAGRVLARTVSAAGAIGATTSTLVDSPDGIVASWAARFGAGMIVVWEDSSTVVAGQRIVWARAFALDGSTASSAQQMSAATRSAIDPRVAVDGEYAWIAWVQSGPESGDRAAIWARAVGPDVMPSRAAVQVSASSGRATGPAIRVATDGSAVVAWADDRDGAPDTELYARSIDTMGTLGTERRLTTAPGASRSASLLAAATPGRTTIVWDDAREGSMGASELYASELDATGARVSDEQRVTSAGGLSQTPWLTRVGADPWIAFRDTRSGSAHVFVRALSCED